MQAGAVFVAEGQCWLLFMGDGWRKTIPTHLPVEKWLEAWSLLRSIEACAAKLTAGEVAA